MQGSDVSILCDAACGLKMYVQREIIYHHERRRGREGRCILEVIIGSFGSLRVPLMRSNFLVCPWTHHSRTEVKSRGWAGAETSAVLQIDAARFTLLPATRSLLLCLLLLNLTLTHSFRSNYNTSTELDASDGFSYGFMAAIWHPIASFLKLSITQLSAGEAGKLKFVWTQFWVFRLSSETDLCLHSC